MLFLFQAEDGIRDLVRSRGLGDVYKRQNLNSRPGARPLTRSEILELQREWQSLQGEPPPPQLSLIHI